jgi:hypothetical protein
MPPALDSGDRKLLLIAGSILLLLIAVTLALAPPPEEKEGQGIPTSYSSTNNGTQAAYLLLRELGYQSERWERPRAELPSETAGKILILAGPSNFPDKKERDALLAFARSGGWIIYAGNYPYLFLESGAVQAPSENGITERPSETFRAIAPSPLTLGAETISLRAFNRWMTTDGGQVPLYGDAQEPVVVTWQLENRPWHRRLPEIVPQRPAVAVKIFIPQYGNFARTCAGAHRLNAAEKKRQISFSRDSRIRQGRRTSPPNDSSFFQLPGHHDRFLSVTIQRNLRAIGRHPAIRCLDGNSFRVQR